MAKIGIAIDNWKRPIFERHLREAGYTNFKWTPGLGPDAGLISVEVERATEASAIHPIVKAAEREAARTKGAHK